MRSAVLKLLAGAGGATAGLAILCGAAASEFGWPHSRLAILHQAIEKLSLTAVLGVVVVGFCCGLLLRRPYSDIAALAQVGAFPVLAGFEILVDPTSHNLWPFEFLVYAFLTCCGWIGLRLASICKRRLSEG